MGVLPGARRSSRERFEFVTGLFPALGERRSSAPARCPAASARWWPWAGR